MKRSGQLGIFGLCLLAVVAFTLLGCGSPAASEPDGFRGVKWGADFASLSGFSQIAKEGDLVFYEKQDDSLQIEEVRLEQVIYGFHKGRFYTAMVYFPSTGLTRVKEIMTRQFGAPATPDNTPSKALWDGSNVSVLLALSGNADSARLVYLYKPIQLEVEINRQ
ncbi:MAG: hypothetical protein AB9866_23945 [Syntrophobacteraceae bacterium]